jgi:hypothetical protein
MCDFSLQSVKSRAAAVGDKLVTHDFGSSTKGFADVNDLSTAVCVMPGTEIAFAKEIEQRSLFASEHKKLGNKVAIFRQVRKDQPHAHHDALELPDGNVVLLTLLAEGQQATILQLPAAPKNEAEAKEQKRLEVAG